MSDNKIGMMIPGNVLKAVSKFTAKADIRKYLHFAVARQIGGQVFIEASDGAIAIRYNATEHIENVDAWPEDFVLWLSKDTLKSVEKFELVGIEVDPLNKVYHIASPSGRHSISNSIEWRFPDVARAGGNTSEDQRMLSMAQFDPRLLSILADANKLLTGSKMPAPPIYQNRIAFVQSLRAAMQRLAPDPSDPIAWSDRLHYASDEVVDIFQSAAANDSPAAYAISGNAVMIIMPRRETPVLATKVEL